MFVKSELKVGVIYVKEGQYTEEEILDNNDHSDNLTEFLTILGDKVRLKGFDKYKGGLDTVHDLTGYHSVYTHWRGQYSNQAPDKLTSLSLSPKVSR